MTSTPPNLLIFFMNTVVFGLFVWGIQKIASNSSDRKIADFKGLIDQQLLSYKNLYDQQLIAYRAEFDKQMEGHKSELKYLNDKLMALHTKRLDIVKEVNDRLVKLNSAMTRLVMMRPAHPDPKEDKKIEEALNVDAYEAYSEFNNYILFNKIYFPEDFANKLEAIRKQYFSAHWDLNSSGRLLSLGLDEAIAREKSIDAIINASTQIREGIPQAIIEVEKEFRKLLGVA